MSPAVMATSAGGVLRLTINRPDKRNALSLAVLAELRANLADWRGLLRQEAPQARPALRALLAGRLVFVPRASDDGERFYEFSGPGTLGSVVAGLALPKAVVAPTGIEPVSSP